MTLGSKIGAAFSLMMVVTGLSFGLITERHFERTIESNYQRLGDGLAKAISQSVLSYTISGNKRKTHKALERVVKGESLINYIVITDFDDKLFSLYFKPTLKHGIDDPAQYEPGPLLQLLERHVVANQPITHQMINNLEARIHVGLDQSQMLQELKQIRATITVMVLLFIVMGILVALYFGHRFGEPVQRLMKMMNLFAEDRLEKVSVLKASVLKASESDIRGLYESFLWMVQERKASQQALEKAYLAKDEFLASMSHELRTPLATIIGNCELLAEQVDRGAADELVGSIARAGRNQLALVNDILDMSKIESGKFSVDEAPYDLSILLSDLEKMFEVKAKDQGVGFRIEQADPESCLLMGDVQRVGQILINLIGNAIKFTEQGEVVLTVWNDGHHLFFKVQDSGIGVSPELVDKLFTRFEQADGSISRRFGGSGLGLYISLNLAKLMGGTIDASSRKGEGSIFQFYLPYNATEKPVQQAQLNVQNDSELQQHFSGKVLIAEDTLELQLLECRILESYGLQVTVAENGREAVEQASGKTFDLILMDMQMPEVDGIEATRILRQQGIKTPIVPLTANVMQKHRDAFAAEGCDEFLTKPINRQELARVLKRYLS